MEILRKGLQTQSPVGKEYCESVDRLSPFRTSLRKAKTVTFSPDKLKDWGKNISPFNPKRRVEETLCEIKIKIPDHQEEANPSPLDVSSVSSLANSLRAKYGKRKLNLLYEERAFEPVDLSVDLCPDWHTTTTTTTTKVIRKRASLLKGSVAGKKVVSEESDSPPRPDAIALGTGGQQPAKPSANSDHLAKDISTEHSVKDVSKTPSKVDKNVWPEMDAQASSKRLRLELASPNRAAPLLIEDDFVEVVL